MNRKEAIDDFKINVAENLIKACEDEFKECLNDNLDDLKDYLFEGIILLIKKAKEVQKDQPEYRLYWIQFEFLRINILNDSYKICVSGYNKSLFLDESSINQEIDLKFLFKPLIKLKEELANNKAKYFGKINDYDISIIVLDAAARCFRMMVEAARNCMWNIDEKVWMNDSIMRDYYFIKWTEYHEKGQVIFAMDNRKKTKEDFLELVKYPKEKMLYTYTTWKNCQFEDCNVSEQKMLFINFKESKLSNINFSKNYLVRAQFKETQLYKCRFDESIAAGSSFEKSQIKECSFENADFRNVNFQKAKLRDVSFKNCDLSNSVFIGCSFIDVSFEDSKLEGAVFSKDDVAFIHLSPEQLQSIYIYGGSEE